MGNANSSQTRRRRRNSNGAEMFAGFQPGTQVGLGVGRPGARVGAGRPGARRWIMPPTVDRNHLDTMDPATYALVRDMLTRQYLAAHGPALMAPPLSPVVAPRGRAHAPAPRGPVVIIQRQATPWRTAREERASREAHRRFERNRWRPPGTFTTVVDAEDWDGRARAPWMRDERGRRVQTLAAESERARQQQRRREEERRRVRRPSKLRVALKRMMGRRKPPTGEAAECVVCLDAPTGVKLKPCGHLVLCEACSQRVDVCPVCREPIAERRATV